MNKITIVLLAIVVFCISLLGWSRNSSKAYKSYEDSLRALYARPVSQWPRPVIDSGAIWSELAPIPDDTTWKLVEEDPQTKLGQLLFFDPRLSSSSQISCSSCHDPDLAWQDGRAVSLGNEHIQGSRNTPSLLNSYIFKKLFWDGRADSFASQASGPLEAHHEMNMNLKKLPAKLSKIEGYKTQFEKAYGTSKIDIKKITDALAAFENTIRSRKTKFDYFMLGDYDRLNDAELRGLHVFRTKARCMNCHSGPFFTDTSFHNIGLTYYGRKYEDLGRYNITQNPEDVGRFKTPSLREAMRTRPWMHNGLFDNITGVINIYNSGMPLPPKGDQVNDPLYPKTDRLIKPLQLKEHEKEDLVAFLNTLTGVPYRMRRPELPK